MCIAERRGGADRRRPRQDFEDGVALAPNRLDSGAAAARLKHLIAISNG